MGELVELTEQGMYCRAADAYLDPSRKVATAIITHAHTDHVCRSVERYICSEACAPLIRRRLKPDADVITKRFGERFTLGDCTVSLHPAGHMLGSAQVRIEHDGEVWVYTGDYKRQPDPSCEPFEPLACDALITEATFSLPLYRWPDPAQVFDDIMAWWDTCRDAGTNAVLYSYSVGKTQRILAELATRTDRRAIVHAGASAFTQAYRDVGIAMLETVDLDSIDVPLSGELVIAPHGAELDAGILGTFEAAFVSGWMQVRKRRAAAAARGFIVSDHVDWPGLMHTIEESGATRIRVTHGDAPLVSKYLRERGYDACPLGGM